MKRTRTSDDKFLALLARMPAPMELAEICTALAWSRQHARQVALRLAREGSVVKFDAASSGTVGRPSDAFALPGAMPLPGARLKALEPHTVVVTPTNEEARVIGMRGRSHAELEYITGPERFQRAVIHLVLLRAFQPGRERPEPVRIARAQAEAAA